MDWPTPQDYNEAIQNPQNCFSDPELKQGAPLLTKLGLPKPITGAFASVYKVNCRTRSWAVRCFLREFADQERRYSAISDKLRAAKLGCTADFDFLARGILIRGRWYPVLKMEWIDGEPISEYIRRNLAQRQVLQSLSRQWIALMASLRKAQIAHGDLQHGNILVSGSVLKLVDYDGMYVPALAGMDSHEVGHPNYQRPGRTERDYHPDLDSFSAWVIFTSISALAIDPRLWNLLDAGDECLLFRRADFEKPRASRCSKPWRKAAIFACRRSPLSSARSSACRSPRSRHWTGRVSTAERDRAETRKEPTIRGWRAPRLAERSYQRTGPSVRPAALRRWCDGGADHRRQLVV